MMSRLAFWSHPEKKRMFTFSEGTHLYDKHLLGTKGANLCELTRIGLPVPPGFVISTETSLDYHDSKKSCSDVAGKLFVNYMKQVKEMERISGHMFGCSDGKTFPLLLSVRTSSVLGNIPGLMKTVLNLGMNDEVAQSMAVYTKNARFAYDAYKRFLEMFGTSVLGISDIVYTKIVNDVIGKKDRVVMNGQPYMDVDDLKEIVEAFKRVVPVPISVEEQLRLAVDTALESWFSMRARQFRAVNDLIDSPTQAGAAVILQTMVFGNINNKAGVGVAYTRHPVTGEDGLCGEFLVNAEGEEAAEGQRPPMNMEGLHKYLPDVYAELQDVKHKLEADLKDMQEVEFTVQNGRLFVLESRHAIRSVQAAMRVATELVHKEYLTEAQALLRIDPKMMMGAFDPQIVEPNLDDAEGGVLGRGVGASAGVVRGRLVFTATQALEQAKTEPVVLVCEGSSEEDESAMSAVAAVLCTTGALSSHTAIFCRRIGKCAITGLAQAARWTTICRGRGVEGSEGVQEQGHGVSGGPHLTFKDGTRLHEGDMVVIDGSAGVIYRGDAVNIVSADADDTRRQSYSRLMHWAYRYGRMSVLASAACDEDLIQAAKHSAAGVGLYKTDGLLLAHECLGAVRALLLCANRHESCDDLRNFLERVHKQQLTSVLQQFPGKRVCVRLFDVDPARIFRDLTPLQLAELAQYLRLDVVGCRHCIDEMMATGETARWGHGSGNGGFRGARMALVVPDLLILQTRAILGAAQELQTSGQFVHVDILIPQVCSEQELAVLLPIVHREANQMFQTGNAVPYLVGAGIESPRGCLRCKFIANEGVAFVLFDTDAITSHTFGFDRTDSGYYMPKYIREHLLPSDPFATLDRMGVGSLLQAATKNLPKHVHFGFVGGHCDAPSIRFFEFIRADFVCCVPHLLPAVTLAAAQARIRRLMLVNKDDALNNLSANCDLSSP